MGPSWPSNTTMYHEKSMQTTILTSVDHGSSCAYKGKPVSRLPLRFLFFLGICVFSLFLVSCQQQRKGVPLAAGDTAPDFMVKDLDGRVHVLTNLVPKPVVLRFFETNCRFCRADTPIINHYFTENSGRGLQVIYVAGFYETREAVDDFVELLDVPFPVVMDGEAKMADLYNIKVYPQTFVIGPDRKILANIFGGVGDAELDELLTGYLAP